MTRGRRLLIHPLAFSAWNESAAQASTHRKDNPSMSGNSTRHWFQWHTSASGHGQHIQGADRLAYQWLEWGFPCRLVTGECLPQTHFRCVAVWKQIFFPRVASLKSLYFDWKSIQNHLRQRLAIPSNRTELCRIWFYWKESQQNYCHENIKMLPLFAIQTPVLMQLRQRQHVVVTLRFPVYAAEVDSNTEPKMRKDPGILNLSSWLFGGGWSVKLWHHFGDFSPKLDDWNLKFMGQEGLLKCHLVLLGECETTHSCEFRIFLSRFTHYDHIMISYESQNHT